MSPARERKVISVAFADQVGSAVEFFRAVRATRCLAMHDALMVANA